MTLKNYLEEINKELKDTCYEEMNSRTTARNVLLNKFNNYEFESEKDAIHLLCAFADRDYLETLKIDLLCEVVGEKYFLEINYNNYKLTVKEKTVAKVNLTQERFFLKEDLFTCDTIAEIKCDSSMYNWEDIVDGAPLDTLSNEVSAQINNRYKEMYVSDEELVCPFDGYKDIMLLTDGCGRGKTTFIRSGLINYLNRNLLGWNGMNISKSNPITCKDVLFLVSRKAILQQQSKYFKEIGENEYELDAFDYEEDDNRIRITTAHKFGLMIKRGKVQRIPRVIVIDEIHSIFSETAFADSLFYTVEWLKENWNSILKIGLTATPQFLTEYVEPLMKDFTFTVLNKTQLPPKYLSQKITMCYRKELKSIYEMVLPTIDENHKALVYTQRATTCYKMAQTYKNSTFMISDYYDKHPEYVEEMNELGYKKYLLEEHKFPKEINTIFINASMREGVDLNDKKITTIIIEAPDLTTIEQVLGRNRNDIENFYIISNYNLYNSNKKNIEVFNALAAELRNGNIYPIVERFGAQERDEKLTKLVYKVGENDYRLNFYAYCYFLYLDNTFVAISNQFENCKITMNHSIATLTYKEYKNILKKYDKNGAEPAVLKDLGEVNKQKAVLQIDKKWFGIKLFKEDRDALAAELNLRDARNRIQKWPTVKKILAASGFEIEEHKRFIIIKEN